MKAQLVFAFPFDVSIVEVVQSVSDHFGVPVTVSPDGAPLAMTTVPAHIKRAVESIGQDNPANGTEMSAAIAFGHLIHGGEGNASGASAPHVPSTAAVETSTTAPVVQTDISAMPSAPVPPVLTAPGAVAPTAPVNATNPASVEFDATGLAWDARIHSGNKTRTPKGEWRAMKGVDKNLVKAVELELRAKYPNGAVANGTAVPTAPAGNAAPAGLPPATPDRAAGLEYANAEAYRVAGKSPIDDATLNVLLSGQPHTLTLTPQQNDWFAVFYAKRNSAFADYMKGNVQAAFVAPVAPQSQTPIGNAAAEQPVVPSTIDASLTAGADTPALVTNAQPGEGLDAVGLPWDARINIPAKIKDAAGIWVQRHDVAPQVKLDVIAELRATLAGNGAAASSQAGPTGSTTDVLPTTAESARGDFPALLRWIAANQTQGRISPQAGPNAARDLGFIGADGNGQLILLRDQSAYWTYVVDMLQGQGAI